jgi:excisionase family DNA binding protein
MDTTSTWRTITEAATVLGVCERTVRRRVARGEYRVERVGSSVLVDIGTEAIPQIAIAAEARAVAEDSRRSQAVALVAFERVSLAFEQSTTDLRRARRTGTTAIVAAAVALAVAGVAVWTAGRWADEVSAARVRIADAEARERFAVSALADIVRVSAARAVVLDEFAQDTVADDCPPVVPP